MISDARLRAHLLSVFHGLRLANEGWVPTSDMNVAGMEAVHLGRIRMICKQLAEAELIKFRPLPGDSGAGIAGMSKITAHGSDVMEGRAQARIALEFVTPAGTSVQRATGRLVADSSADAPTARSGNSAAKALPDVEAKKAQPEPTPELFTLRPGLWGMSIDLKEAYRRLRRRFVG